MASAARLGFEHGADLVKSYYTGGPRMETVEETLQAVAEELAESEVA